METHADDFLFRSHFGELRAKPQRPPWTLPRLVGKMTRTPGAAPVCSTPDRSLSAERTELGPPVLTEGGVAARGGGAGVGEVLARKSCRPAPGRAEG